MPGYILHLLHGDLILKEYFKNISDDERNQFRIGLIMPDSNKEIHKSDDKSHYIDKSTIDKVLQLPDLSIIASYVRLFPNNYYILGYAAHLYLDKLFFSDYFPKNVMFIDKNGNKTDLSTKAENVVLSNGKKIPISLFYSEDYLYGDYTMINKYIIKNYNLLKLKEIDVISPISETDITNFPIVLKAIEKFVATSSGKINMNVFKIEELEEAIKKYAFGFKQWLDGLLLPLFQKGE